jgi:multiple sugar transport system permease protein
MKKNKTMIALFIAPTVISLLVMYLYPVTRTVIMSFFDVDSVTAGLSEWSFNGLANYTKIFHTASFVASMKNMLVIWLVGGIISLFLSMVMAVVLTSGIRGAKFFKATIYMPNIISAVALATMWVQYIFNYDYGLLNQIAQLLGGDKVRWLGSDMIF